MSGKIIVIAQGRNLANNSIGSQYSLRYYSHAWYDSVFLLSTINGAAPLDMSSSPACHLSQAFPHLHH